MVYGRKYKGLGYLRKVSTQLNWKVDSTLQYKLLLIDNDDNYTVQMNS